MQTSRIANGICDVTKNTHSIGMNALRFYGGKWRSWQPIIAIKNTHTHICAHTNTRILTCMYIFMCVCVCVRECERVCFKAYTFTQTHTHIYIIFFYSSMDLRISREMFKLLLRKKHDTDMYLSECYKKVTKVATIGMLMKVPRTKSCRPARHLWFHLSSLPTSLFSHYTKKREKIW